MILRIFTALYVLISSINSYAQTENHIAVKGTHCALAPPEGFVIADRFNGFQNNTTGATIMVNEIPEYYNKIIAGLTSEAFLKQKIVINKTEKVQFNNAEATLFSATQTQSGIDFEKLMLVFGSGKNTILVNGIYPVSFKEESEEVIRKAIFTTVFNDATFNEANAIFDINPTGTDFKRVKYDVNSSVYSTDSIGVPNAPLFILSNSVDKVSKENRKTYAESRIMSLPRGEQNKILTVKEITLDSLSGYEIIAEGKSSTGLPQLVYQVIVYNEQEDYYIMVGTATKNKDIQLQTFRKLASTFKLRKS